MTSYFDITTLENVKASWVTLEPLYFGIARKLSEYLPGLSFFYWWLLLYYLLLHPVFSAVVANLVKNWRKNLKQLIVQPKLPEAIQEESPYRL
mgnify:CR=1 FL=1